MDSKKKPINIHIESIWLQGAISLLLALERHNAIDFKCGRGHNNNVYNHFIIKELKNRESMLKFLYSNSMRFSEHKTDKNGKLITVKVIIE